MITIANLISVCGISLLMYEYVAHADIFGLSCIRERLMENVNSVVQKGNKLLIA